MGGPCVSYCDGLRSTIGLFLVICLSPVTTGGQRNNTTIGAPQNETYIDVDSDMDRVTTAGYNVTWCVTGFGYPEQCPQPGDPITHTKCCRYYQEPACCEPRARKVCAIKDKGLYVITAWDIDPELEYDAIFCPQPDQSDQYVSCGYTRGDMTCFNKQISLVLVWVTSIIIFVLFPIAFVIFTIYSIRAERKEERQMLAEGRFVKQEVEIEERLTKKKAEKAAAVKAAEKEADKARDQREKRKRQMAMANGRKKSSVDTEAKERKESSADIEAKERKESSADIEAKERKESSADIEANQKEEISDGVDENGRRNRNKNIEVTSIEANIEES